MAKRLKLTVLVEDTVNVRDIIAKHGLSIFINVDEKNSFLMDTGPTPDVVLHNAEILGIDLNNIGVVFLSHGHYDHTGGLVGILKRIDRKVPVIAHPKAFDMKLKIEPSLKYIGSPFKQAEVEASGGVLLLARNPVTIMKGVKTSGEVERNATYEKVTGFWTIDGETFKEEIMPDDQAVLINVEGKGLVIVSGCAHSGIINTIRQAQKVIGVNKIYAVLGGFHLNKASDGRIQYTIEDLLKINPNIIGPCHCTGSKAIRKLKEAFEDRCKALKSGDTLDL